MIVANYPGGGGHRYSLFLKNASFDQVDQHMHQPNYVHHNYKYLTAETVQDCFFDTNQLKNTHTLNTTLIEKFFPGHKIIKIKSDLKKSLHRQWRVVARLDYAHRPIHEQVGQMFDIIAWHHNYYSLYPVDWTADQIVDIDTDNTEFGKIMRRELDKTDPLFELAWQVFMTHGPNAPIIDLYNEYARQQ